VTSRNGADFTVFFVDYGNTDIVSRDRLKPLDPSVGIQLLSPQAVECRLAHLIASPPTDQADGERAAYSLSEQAYGKPMLARVEDRNAGVLLVTLIDPGSQASINDALVEEGCLRVAKTFEKRAAPIVRALREKELAAKTGRKGMWKYGDIEEDDDFEFGMRARDKEQAANPWKK
jgi:staphylococcal nuclease domain-containing protein 1